MTNDIKSNSEFKEYSTLKECFNCQTKLQDLISDCDDNYRGWCSSCHIVWLLPRPKFQIELMKEEDAS